MNHIGAEKCSFSVLTAKLEDASRNDDERVFQFLFASTLTSMHLLPPDISLLVRA